MNGNHSVVGFATAIVETPSIYFVQSKAELPEAIRGSIAFVLGGE